MNIPRVVMFPFAFLKHFRAIVKDNNWGSRRRLLPHWLKSSLRHAPTVGPHSQTSLHTRQHLVALEPHLAAGWGCWVVWPNRLLPKLLLV